MTVAALAIVGSTLFALAIGATAAFLLMKWSEVKPCFGDHEFTNYSRTGDYRIVAVPTSRILPRHRLTCQYWHKYRAECDRDGCFQHDIEWHKDAETETEVNSLQELGDVAIEQF